MADVNKLISANEYRVDKRVTVNYSTKPTSISVGGTPKTFLSDDTPRVNITVWPSGT